MKNEPQRKDFHRHYVTESGQAYNLHFEYYFDGHYGYLMINGLHLPHSPKIDPLGKIWWSARKKFKKLHGVDSVGDFRYGEDFVDCKFFPNFSVLDKEPELTVESYLEKFESLFDEQIKFFDGIIEKFILADINGYEDYLFYSEISDDSKNDYETIDEMFNDFLFVNKLRRRDKKKK